MANWIKAIYFVVILAWVIYALSDDAVKSWLRSRPDLTSTARRRSPSATSRNRMSMS